MKFHRWPTVKRSAIRIHCDSANTLFGTTSQIRQRGISSELSAALSIGDIAKFAGADIALRCSQSLDWRNLDLRRTILGIIVRWIQRAYPNMDDMEIIEDVMALESWSKGEANVELNGRDDTLLNKVIGISPEPPHTSDEIAIIQIWMLMQVVLGDQAEVGPWTNYGAASVAIVGSQLISDARNDPEETARQIDDIVEHFPLT